MRKVLLKEKAMLSSTHKIMIGFGILALLILSVPLIAILRRVAVLGAALLISLWIFIVVAVVIAILPSTIRVASAYVVELINRIERLTE